MLWKKIPRRAIAIYTLAWSSSAAFSVRRSRNDASSRSTGPCPENGAPLINHRAGGFFDA